MRKIRVYYIFEPEGWSAESPDRPRWSAWGESLEEVRELAHEGLPLAFGEPLALEEHFPPTNGVMVDVRLRFTGVGEASRATQVLGDPVLQ